MRVNVANLSNKKKNEIALIEFLGNDVAGVELLEQEKRDSFFAKYSLILGLLAFVSLYLSYRVFPSAAWLVYFDPIQIDFNIKFLLDEPFTINLFGWGVFLEFIRALWLLLILWLVIGKQFSNFALKTMIMKDKINLDVDKPSLGPLPLRRSIISYAECLWNKNWLFASIVFIGVIFYVYLSATGFGDGDSKEDKLCHPAGVLPWTVAENIPPVKPSADYMCPKEGMKDKYATWQSYYHANSDEWSLNPVIKERLKNEIDEVQAKPYWFYLIYCMINYFFIALVIIIHSHAYINTYMKGFKAYFRKRELFAQNSTPEQLLEKAKDDYSKLQFYLRHFLNPLGLLATLILLLAFFDWQVGSFTLSGQAKAIYLLVYFVAVFILFWNVYSILIQVDSWSKAIKDKSKFVDNKELKSALEEQASNYSVDEIVSEVKTSLPWRVLAMVIKFLRKFNTITSA